MAVMKLLQRQKHSKYKHITNLLLDLSVVFLHSDDFRSGRSCADVHYQVGFLLGLA